MSIHRYTRTSDFTIIGNDCLRDDELTAEALGVLCYLRGKPHDWKVMPTELAGRFKCGRDRIQRILKELICHGYIKKIRRRDPATQEWQAVEFVVFDTRSEPLPENTVVASEPLTENPAMENPAMENPAPAFPTVLNTDLPNTDSTKHGSTNSVRSKRTRSTDAEIDQVFEERFWPAYPKRKGQRGKPEAMKKFRTLVKGGANVEKIIDAANKERENWKPRLARKPAEAQFIPMAATWLNKRRWDDEQGAPEDHIGETNFDLVNQLEQRVKATDNETPPRRNETSRDGYSDGHGLIDG